MQTLKVSLRTLPVSCMPITFAGPPPSVLNPRLMWRFGTLTATDLSTLVSLRVLVGTLTDLRLEATSRSAMPDAGYP